MREDSSRQPVNGMRKPINRLDQWLQSTNEATINDRNNKLTDLEWMVGLVPHCWKDGEVVSCLVGCNQEALRFVFQAPTEVLGSLYRNNPQEDRKRRKRPLQRLLHGDESSWRPFDFWIPTDYEE